MDREASRRFPHLRRLVRHVSIVDNVSQGGSDQRASRDAEARRVEGRFVFEIAEENGETDGED